MNTIKAFKHVEFNNYFQEIDISKLPMAMGVSRKEKWLYNKLKTLKTGYLIVPSYNYINKPIETQLAVTGKVKKNETPQQAIQREIAEEIGFNINTNFKIEQIKDKRNIYFSIVSEINNSEDKYEYSDHDDKSDKIITWYHTKKIDNEKIFNRKRISSDDIAGQTIVIISVENIIKIFELYLKDCKTKYKENSYCFILQ